MEPQIYSAKKLTTTVIRLCHRLNVLRIIALLGFFVSFPVENVSAQNFSCSLGTQPACLDYGDKVCSSLGKCVDQSAACFDAYQCDYEGFTCKSNVTEIADKFNNLISDYDDLVGRFNSLLSDHDDLIAKARRISTNYEDYVTCIDDAYDLDEAKSCTAY